jgi:hypothetical protein
LWFTTSGGKKYAVAPVDTAKCSEYFISGHKLFRVQLFQLVQLSHALRKIHINPPFHPVGMIS